MRRGRAPRAQYPTILFSLILGAAVVAFWPGKGAHSSRSAPDDLSVAAGPVVASEAIKAKLRGTLAARSRNFDQLWTPENLPKKATARALTPMALFASTNPSDEVAGRFDAVFTDPNAQFDVLFDENFAGSDWELDPLSFASSSSSETKCLADAIYFEARGESREGQIAVAQVVLNRVKNPNYPKSICGVVYQGDDNLHRCQFSFACDGKRDRITDKGAWSRAVSIARQFLANREALYIESVGSSTNYHATSVSPRWASTMKRMDTIGSHIFYVSQRRG
jgi:spore germination cell wall hydrolase CwlJ-like protein